MIEIVTGHTDPHWGPLWQSHVWSYLYSPGCQSLISADLAGTNNVRPLPAFLENNKPLTSARYESEWRVESLTYDENNKWSLQTIVNICGLDCAGSLLSVWKLLIYFSQPACLALFNCQKYFFCWPDYEKYFYNNKTWNDFSHRLARPDWLFARLLIHNSFYEQLWSHCSELPLALF